MKIKLPPKVFLTAGACLLLVHFARAQDAESQRQVASQETERQSFLDQVSAYTQYNQSQFAPGSPGDSDLGEQLLLTRKERYRPFQVYANIYEYWTNNAGLTQHNMQSDWLMVPQFGANFVPKIANNLYGEFTAREQLFRYAVNNQLNFNAFDATAGLVYVIRPLGDTSLYARYHYSMLNNPEMNTTTYNAQMLNFGVQKPFAISRAHFVYVGASAEVIIAGEPESALKNDFGVYAGYQVALTRQLNASAYYRISLFNYVQGGRDDLNQNIGFGLTWNVTDWFSINSVLSFAFNNSNRENDSYWSVMTGAGLAGQIKF